MSESLPRLRDDLRIIPLTEGGGSSYVIEDPLRNVFFKIGLREYRFLCRLHKIKSLQDLCSGDDLSDNDVNEEEALSILQWLAAKQLLQNQKQETMQAIEEAELKAKQKSLLSRLNIISFRVPLFNPDPFLNHFHSWLSWLAGPLFLALWVLVGGAAIATLLVNWSRFLSESAGFFSPANVFFLGVVWVVLKLLHELSHAIVCKRYGGGVYDFGILFILFIPLTYVNASTSWSFPTKWQRIHVAVAGIYMELFVAWLATIYWVTHMGTPGGLIAHNTVLIAGVSSLLFNANPLMRFDGYYVLSDITNIPNLYSRGLAAVRASAMRFWLGIHGDTESRKPSLFVKVYGIGIYCWRILILFSLGYLASKMFSGWGLLLTIVAAIGWLYQPFAGFFSKMPDYRAANPKFVAHLTFRLALVGSVGALLLFGVSWKKNITIPAVVLFEEQYSIRAETSGFVESIMVNPGDLVQKGQKLLLLENNGLQSMAKMMELEAQIMAVEKRQAHVRRKHSELQILEERQKVQAAQYANVIRDREALTVLAPGAGVVVGERLESLIGTFVRKGQELFLVVKPENKQLLVSVSQDDVEAFLGNVGGQVDVDMRPSGLGQFSAVIERVAPTASRSLLHFSLAANYGGPFDVKPATGTEQGFLLFSPRFTVTVELPDEIKQELRSGQQAYVLITGTSRTPGSILWRTIRDWFFGRQQTQ